ncbi:MAG: hypothetical protein EZS28_007824 [Streblomastix strix]|uniref:Uncharacterized protein n=1 Tax=Streblomastix strix TaxID=222440 RepID=A0A5J4WNZ7_9EUKA|nr:MAG: hypothetical protein EZS28_007824 [Streblomastix strix]
MISTTQSSRLPNQESSGEAALLSALENTVDQIIQLHKKTDPNKSIDQLLQQQERFLLSVTSKYHQSKRLDQNVDRTLADAKNENAIADERLQNVLYKFNEMTQEIRRCRNIQTDIDNLEIFSPSEFLEKINDQRKKEKQQQEQKEMEKDDDGQNSEDTDDENNENNVNDLVELLDTDVHGFIRNVAQTIKENLKLRRQLQKTELDIEQQEKDVHDFAVGYQQVKELSHEKIATFIDSRK